MCYCILRPELGEGTAGKGGIFPRGGVSFAGSGVILKSLYTLMTKKNTGSHVPVYEGYWNTSND
jgi:hypothetical protein